MGKYFSSSFSLESCSAVYSQTICRRVAFIHYMFERISLVGHQKWEFEGMVSLIFLEGDGKACAKTDKRTGQHIFVGHKKAVKSKFFPRSSRLSHVCKIKKKKYRKLQTF